MFSDILHIDWNEFHFLRPNFLWTLVPVAITLIIGLFGLRDQVKWKYYIAPHLRPFMIKKGSERLKIVMQVLSFFIISIAVFGLAGQAACATTVGITRMQSAVHGVEPGQTVV